MIRRAQPCAILYISTAIECFMPAMLRIKITKPIGIRVIIAVITALKTAIVLMRGIRAPLKI
jgi:hypothetical protein